MRYRDLEQTSAQQRITAELMRQLNAHPRRILDGPFHRRTERRLLRVIAYCTLGGGLFLAALVGFLMEADIPTPTAATVIHDEAPAPLPSEIYDGD